MVRHWDIVSQFKTNQNSCWLDVPSTPIPPLFWTTFGKLHHVHAFWKFNHLYGTPNKCIQMAPGHLIQYIWGNNLGVRAAAHILMIGTRAMEAVYAKKRVEHRYAIWKNTLKGRSPNYKKLSPSKSQWNLLAPSIDYKAQIFAKKNLRVCCTLFLSNLLSLVRKFPVKYALN